MTGMMGVLNVGAGDTKLTFDNKNPAEVIRSSRIVTDMLRRGFILLVETIDANGDKAYTRVREFDENTAEYIIADFDPVQAMVADEVEQQRKRATEDTSAETGQGEAGEAAPEAAATAEPGVGRLRAIRTKRVKASETRGIAVARSAGG